MSNVASLTKFLLMHLQEELKLTQPQVELIEANLNHEEILKRIEEANWHVAKEEVQNGIRIYYLKENRFCSCGEYAIHFHDEHWPCCGKQGCCPEIVESVDPELELACILTGIREKIEKKKQTTAESVLV